MWGRKWWKVWENEVLLSSKPYYTLYLFLLWLSGTSWNVRIDLLQIVTKNSTCQLIILACSENVHSSRE